MSILSTNSKLRILNSNMNGYFILVNRKGSSIKHSQMIKRDILCDHMITVWIKLRTLRDSCSGIFKTRKYPPSLLWFDSTAATCQEAMDWIEEVVLILKRSGEQRFSDADSDDDREDSL